MKYPKIALFVLTLVLTGCSQYWQGSQYCTVEPEATAIGRDQYPINTEKYGDIGFLGELFTADDCGSERLMKIFGVQGEKYTLGPDIGLNNSPSSELLKTLDEVGFVPGSTCQSMQKEQCKHWTLKKEVPLIEILKLKSHAREIQSSGCILCG